VLFIDAVNEVARERSMSFLRPEHQAHIAAAYHAWRSERGFASIATLDEIAGQGYSLSIPLYVRRLGVSESPAPYAAGEQPGRLRSAWETWEQEGRVFWQQMDRLVEMLDGLGEAGQ